MEVILLLGLIILIIFAAGQGARTSRIDETLKNIQRQLFQLNQKESTSAKEPEKHVKTDKPVTDVPPSRLSEMLAQEEVPGEGERPVPDSHREPPEGIKVTPQTESIPEPEKEIEKPASEPRQEQIITDEELEALAFAAERVEEPAPQNPPRPVMRNEPVRKPDEDWYAKFRANNPDLEKFIGENILSKVAITILVLGIAFFVKYAIDKNWINEVARVGIGMLAGGVVLAFAHRLRARFKAFSSVLVAGGISVFYFTIGIGFHEYHVFSQVVAFMLMLLVTAFSVFISVAYDRIELAVLSIIGGFATPFLVSTGEGNYIVLFTYILILDAGMLALAYMRRWHLVNILSYAFTILLYVSWLESKVIHKVGAPYMGALLFGAAFYIIFILMNIVNNIKARREFSVAEISILLSNTFIYYACGMHILSNFHPEWKGLFSIAMALVNMICAWLLHKKYKADERLVYMLIGLTLTFVTVSVPVQLEGNYITLVWALESVLLMWLGLRSRIVLYRFTSVIVLCLMLLSLFLDWVQIYRAYSADNVTHMVFINKGFITGLVSAFSVVATVYLLKREVRKEVDTGETVTWLGVSFHAGNYSATLRVLFVFLTYLVGALELNYQLKVHLSVDTAFYIVVMCYHLLYLSVLNVMLPKYQSKDVNESLFFVNVLSVAVFVVGFSLLPLFDLKENIIRPQTNYTGFIFHYVNLAAALFLVTRIFESRKKMFSDGFSGNLVYACVLTSLITYLCSIELLLHIAHLRISNVVTGLPPESISKLGEYETVRRHVVKAGFPILWGIVSFGVLYFGMKKHYKTFRISALLLIALTILKLFVYDIRTTSEGGKILAFIILGIVLLVISFMYQKIKTLIIEGKPGHEVPPAS